MTIERKNNFISTIFVSHNFHLLPINSEVDIQFQGEEKKNQF